MTMELDVQNLFLPNTIDRGGRVFAAIRDALVAKGWIMMGSGSGTIGAAFENTEQTGGPYDVFDTTGNVPWKTGMNPAGSDNFYDGVSNHFSNYAAWMRLREPSPSTREFIWQRYTLSGSGNITSGYSGLIQFSPVGFTNGNADKDSPPTSPGPTASWLSNSAWFNATGTDQHYMNMLVSDSARAGNVWPFTIMIPNSTQAQPYWGQMCYESLLNTEVTDDEPWIVKAGANTGVSGISTTTSNTTWYMRRQVDLAYDNGSLAGYNLAGGTVPGTSWAAAPNQDGRSRALPIVLGDNLEGWKGRCEHLYWNPKVREYPSTHFVTTTEARLYWGNLLIPWKQNVTPAL